MNLHQPERQPHETQAEYRSRQQRSSLAVQAMLRGTNEREPIGGKPASREDKRRAAIAAKKRKAVGPKPLAVRVRRPKRAIKPTWPATPNQMLQSRPVHNLHPNRAPDGKREKPKSAVAKRMDRPERVAAIDRGHAKLMRFFGVVG